MTNHRPNKYPAPCCECPNKRVRATCCVDQVGADKHGVMTTTPRCYCREHCVVCREAAEKAKAAGA